jgi:hypothetical protein
MSRWQGRPFVNECPAALQGRPTKIKLSLSLPWSTWIVASCCSPPRCSHLWPLLDPILSGRERLELSLMNSCGHSGRVSQLWSLAYCQTFGTGHTTCPNLQELEFSVPESYSSAKVFHWAPGKSEKYWLASVFGAHSPYHVWIDRCGLKVVTLDLSLLCLWAC